MRVAALAVAVVAAFVGVMYLRFSGDAVRKPEATPSPPPAPQSVADHCAGYSRYPRPPQCGTPAGPIWWSIPTVPRASPAPRGSIGGVKVQPPFARVVKADNTCLYIHSAPALNAPIVDCAAEGVLLTLGIGTAQYPNVVRADGHEWWSVITPGGTEGFAAGEYLER